MTSDVTRTPPAGLFTLVVDQWTEPFWAACREHQLVVPRCADCGTIRFPPGPFCPNCRLQPIEWVELPGTGSVYSYTIVSRSLTPEMDDSIPYAPAVIALDGADGRRLISCVVGASLDSVRVGARVRVSWEDRADGETVPRFVLDEERPDG
jgi:uncharacterized OB-fold protein